MQRLRRAHSMKRQALGVPAETGALSPPAGHAPCLICGREMQPRPNEKPAQFKRRIYCSRTCTHISLRRGYRHFVDPEGRLSLQKRGKWPTEMWITKPFITAYK